MFENALSSTKHVKMYRVIRFGDAKIPQVLRELRFCGKSYEHIMNAINYILKA